MIGYRYPSAPVRLRPGRAPWLARRRRLWGAFVAGVGLGILVVWFVAWRAFGGAWDGDLDCGDLANRRTATAIYAATPNDPHGLDGHDADGEPCESLPE